MSVLILKNVRTEGPGTIEDYLVSSGKAYRVVDLASEDFPQAGDSDTLVMLGGPMSVNEVDRYPFILKEIGLAADFMKEGRKVFGVCLGAQIMAKALGARVYPGTAKEIGWYDIELLNGGLRDSLMGRLALHPRAGDFWRRFRVFHWHGETFDIPEGAERLARSELYMNQAFRYKSSYAFQFHIEVKREMIYEWLGSEPVDMDTVRRETDRYYEDYCGRARSFYHAFFNDSGKQGPGGGT